MSDIIDKLPAEAAWAEELDCAITVCDTEGNILYMNDKSRLTNCPGTTMVGQNMLGCHSERSQAIIRRLIEKGETNFYTISKRGQKKLIYQTPWRKDGKVCGLVEISLVISENMPHYNRD